MAAQWHDFFDLYDVSELSSPTDWSISNGQFVFTNSFSNPQLSFTATPKGAWAAFLAANPSADDVPSAIDVTGTSTGAGGTYGVSLLDVANSYYWASWSNPTLDLPGHDERVVPYALLLQGALSMRVVMDFSRFDCAVQAALYLDLTPPVHRNALVKHTRKSYIAGESGVAASPGQPYKPAREVNVCGSKETIFGAQPGGSVIVGADGLPTLTFAPPEG